MYVHFTSLETVYAHVSQRYLLLVYYSGIVYQVLFNSNLFSLSLPFALIGQWFVKETTVRVLRQFQYWFFYYLVITKCLLYAAHQMFEN